MGNILFLDLSSKSSGWAIGDQYGALITYGCIVSGSTNVFKRIQVMRDNIQKLIAEHNITKVVFEEVFEMFSNTRTQKVLMWVQGIVLMAIYEINPKVEYDFVIPSSWRSKLGIKTGRGVKRESLKQADVNYVKDKYGIDANDDVADAICIHDAYYIAEKPNPNDWT